MVKTRVFVLLALLAGACRTAPPESLQARLDGAAGGARMLLPEGPVERLVVRRPVLLEGVAGTRLAGLEVAAEGVRVRTLVVDGTVEVAAGATLDATGVGIEGGLRVARGATASLAEVRLGCAPGATAVRVEGMLAARGLVVTGPCLRGVDVVAGGEATLERATLEGARLAGVRVVEGRLTLADVTASLEPGLQEGVVLFAARSAIEGRGVTLHGGDQGLLARASTTRLEGLAVSGAVASGAAFVGGTATLSDLTLTGPFRHAGLFVADDTTVVVRGAEVRSAGLAGVLVLRAKAELRDVRVDGATVDEQGDFGHGVVLEESTATLGAVAVVGAEGAAVYASQSEVGIESLRAERVGAGLAITTRSRARVQDLSVAGPSTLGAAVWNGAALSLSSGSVDAALGLVACPGAGLKPGAVRLPANARPACTLEVLPRSWHRLVRERGE